MLGDHLGQFDSNFRNVILDQIPDDYTVFSEYIMPHEVREAYPRLEFKFSAYEFLCGNYIYEVSELAGKTVDHQQPIWHFLSCFNRHNNSGRHILLALLHQKGWADPRFVTKHFALDFNQLKHAGIDTATIDFRWANQIISYDFLSPIDHIHNFAVVSPIIKSTFVHLVSETINFQRNVAFPTEKFLYPIACKRLWIASAPSNYHRMIAQTFGFKLYDCFDYHFDDMWDSQRRLTTMLTMLEKFKSMTPTQWENVYRSQQQVIEYNYNHLKNFDFFDLIAGLDQVPDEHTHMYRRRLSACYSRFISSKLKKNIVLPNSDK